VNKNNNTTNIEQLRGADFKIACILLVFCTFLLWVTSSFPMTGSFGGVDSVWYVSPALFPLITLLVLVVTSSMLLVRAIRANGHKSFFSGSSWIGDLTKPINKDRWYVIFALALYIYLYVPSVDFFLATSLFLFTLTLRFHIEQASLAAWMIKANWIAILAVFVMRYIDENSLFILSQNSTLNEPLIFHTDLAFIAIITITIIKFWLATSGQKTLRSHLLLTTLLVPLFLMFSFNFLLQVPMPVEYGTVIKGLEFIWYDIFSL
jgi:hypothetical protein